jgi:hypothetical protein
MESSRAVLAGGAAQGECRAACEAGVSAAEAPDLLRRPDQGLRRSITGEGPATMQRLRWQPSDCQLSLQGFKNFHLRANVCGGVAEQAGSGVTARGWRHSTAGAVDVATLMLQRALRRGYAQFQSLSFNLWRLRSLTRLDFGRSVAS